MCFPPPYLTGAGTSSKIPKELPQKLTLRIERSLTIYIIIRSWLHVLMVAIVEIAGSGFVEKECRGLQQVCKHEKALHINNIKI